MCFFPLLVHRPDLEVCSDSHLDVLVHIHIALWVTQHNTFVGLFRSGLMLTFCWSATGDESDLNLSLAFFSLRWCKTYFTDADPPSVPAAIWGQSVSKGWLEVASTIHWLVLMSTIFGCLSVLVSCKARPHSGEGKLKPCVSLGVPFYYSPSLSLHFTGPGGCLSG